MNSIPIFSVPTSHQSEDISDIDALHTWISALCIPETRETALLELCKRRECIPDFAPTLWFSFGAIAALLQEICAVYPFVIPQNLTAHLSNRVCNALALLQCLASHQDTRSEFLKANIPFYLYPFLGTNNRTRPFEYLRLTSLGVIGALVKTDEPEVISFLLGSEIIPLCLLIMESGTELSKTVATFIMQKLLQDEVGLSYICQTYERFAHVATVLDKMVVNLSKEQSLRLLKHVIRCYQRLSDDPRARDALRIRLPEQFMNGTFAALLEPDLATKRSLNQFMRQMTMLPGNGTSGSLTNGGTVTVTTTTNNTLSSSQSNINSVQTTTSPPITSSTNPSASPNSIFSIITQGKIGNISSTKTSDIGK